MFSRTSRLAREQERRDDVHALFALIPSDSNSRAVFEDIRAQAVGRQYGWKNRLNDYLQGLRTAGAIDSDRWVLLSNRIIALPDGEYSSLDAWRMVGTTVLIASSLAVFCFFSIIQWTSVVVLYVATMPVIIVLLRWTLKRQGPPVHLAQLRSSIADSAGFALCAFVVGVILME